MILGSDLGGSATKLAAMDGGEVRLCRYIPHGKMAAEDSGEIQLTAYGISGIPVFQVSR